MQYKISHMLGACCSVLALGMLTSGANAADMQIQRMDADSILIPEDSTSSKTAKQETDIYIVQMVGDPIVAYEGGISGYKATKPGKGEKVNPNSAHVKKYAAHLEKQQDQMIQSAGATKVYSYRYAFNAFAARMAAADAEALKGRSDVVNVWKDEILQLQTDNSPTYIGLTEGGDAWSKGYAGENIVIGVVDTGVWPEHPSFADIPTPKKGNKGPSIPYGPASSFAPSGCDFGNNAANPLDTAAACNNKLLAARCYNSGFSSGPDSNNPCGGNGSQTGSFEFQSARDYNGHGSHTASTAGGNNGVPAYTNGNFQGLISGVAPRARIAAYKACWDGPNPNVTTDDGCASSDTAAAIDQAVIDGVDVINYSIGGSSNSFSGAADIAFLFAADAGVFVATSNGNRGPGAGTVGTPSGVPWITAVGATQDNGVFYAAVKVNAPASIAGDYVGVEGNGPVQLADTGPISAGIELVSDTLACGAIAPMPGKIALASRGACPFSIKYNNAAAAGARAIIVYNNSPAATITMSAPGTSIPGLMITQAEGLLLAGEAGVNATLGLIPASNRIAGFSSRGPNNGAPDIIKPDVSAPGVAILAAGPGTDAFMSINGTSMASPHVAGAFALLKQAHPDWSAAEARSALMTTARQGLKKTFGDAPADPFDIGAGEILPSDAFDPGLAYDAGFLDYLAFSCDNNVQLVSDGFCAVLNGAGYPSDGSDLNLPSIGIADLLGSQTITRTVTSVANNNGNKSYTVSIDAPPGIDVSVSPTTIKLKPGQSASYEVTFTVNSAAIPEQWVFGSLTWSHGGEYSVRSPIAVKTVALSTVSEVDGNADASGNGSVAVPVTFGYAGAYNGSVSGIEPSFFGEGNITSAAGTDWWCVDLPAFAHLRIAMFDEDTSVPGADDLDLRVYRGDADCETSTTITSLGTSGGATTEESVDISDGVAGSYWALVDYFAAANGTDSNYKIWYQPVVGDNGNTLITAPASAVPGASDTVTVDYTDLVPTRNLGILHHADGDGEIARTILDIDAR